MKKSFIIIAAAATIFAACAGNDSYKEIDKQENNAISFNTFTSKQTRAENSSALYTWAFLNNHTSFQVWGYKDVAPDKDKPVFDGDEVTVGGTVANTTYTYAPLRFWDKTAGKYHFYAAAPADATGWELVKDNIGDNAIDAGYFKTTSSISGVNLQNISAAPSADLVNYFKEKADIDKMIAAPCDFLNSRFAKANPEAVQLNFNHILSKLNVTVRRGDNLINNGNNVYNVVVTKFEVVNMHKAASFDESKASGTTLSAGTNTRWTLTGTDKVTYKALTNSAATGLVLANNKTPIYIVESLVIPQDIAFKRVALDGKSKDAVTAQVAQYYTSYAEYCAAKPVEHLTEAEFDAIIADPSNASPEDLAEVTKVPAIPAEAAIDAVTADADHPYFVITYTINDEEFTAYYNLAAAFGSGTTEDDPTTTDVNEASIIAFNEGWQNTLNIAINPDKIEFTADVADWATYKNETVYITEDE